MAKVKPTAGNAPSAAPGEKELKAKKEKVKRVLHPALQPNAEGKATVQLEKIPDDFDPKLHKPLGRKNLKDESLWYELQARKFDAKATECRRQAEESKKLGGIKDRSSAKKLLALQKRIDEVTSKLSASGVDVAALLEAVKAKQKANGDAAATTDQQVQPV